MKRVLFIAAMLVSGPALAEDVSTRTLCQMLPVYQPDPSVNYQAGVDVHGKPVVPGDVNKVLRNNYDAVEIPVDYNLLNNLNVNLPAGSEMNARVAMLRVYHDGRVKYNEQDVTAQAQSLCTLRAPAYDPAPANAPAPAPTNYIKGQAYVPPPLHSPEYIRQQAMYEQRENFYQPKKTVAAQAQLQPPVQAQPPVQQQMTDADPMLKQGMIAAAMMPAAGEPTMEEQAMMPQPRMKPMLQKPMVPQPVEPPRALVAAQQQQSAVIQQTVPPQAMAAPVNPQQAVPIQQFYLLPAGQPIPVVPAGQPQGTGQYVTVQPQQPTPQQATQQLYWDQPVPSSAPKESRYQQ